MISVDGTTIMIPKNDSGQIKFHFTNGVPANNTDIYFVVASNVNATQNIIRKKTTVQNADVTFAFSGVDTNLAPDRYIYSLRIYTNNGYDTPINQGIFEILSAVHVEEEVQA